MFAVEGGVAMEGSCGGKGPLGVWQGVIGTAWFESGGRGRPAKREERVEAGF